MTNYKGLERTIYFLLKKLILLGTFLLNMLNIKYYKKVKVALCIVARRENKYIKEFVDYYRKLGIKKIFLYDNNNDNEENFESVLKKEIQINFVEIVDYRGLYKPQFRAYTECYNNNKNDFDWIAFYDVDEFLYLVNYTNIHQFLSQPSLEKCQSIIINWKYYGDNNNLYYERKPLLERFTETYNYNEIKKDDDKYFIAAGKAMVRGGLNISWYHFPHYLKDIVNCRPNGNLLKNPLSYPNHSNAFIKHFATKSTEEYALKMFKGTVNSSYKSNKENITYLIKNYYFRINKVTEEKIKLFNKILGFTITI